MASSVKVSSNHDPAAPPKPDGILRFAAGMSGSVVDYDRHYTPVRWDGKGSIIDCPPPLRQNRPNEVLDAEVSMLGNPLVSVDRGHRGGHSRRENAGRRRSGDRLD